MDIVPLLGKIADQSFLGILLVIAFYVIYVLYKENKNLQELRIKDALETRDKYIEPLKGMQQTLDLILTLLQTAKGRR